MRNQIFAYARSFILFAAFVFGMQLISACAAAFQDNCGNCTTFYCNKCKDACVTRLSDCTETATTYRCTCD